MPEMATCTSATDFGVSRLKKGKKLVVARRSGGMPPVAVYGLTIDANSKVLYAATHGRGIWRLDLSRSQDN